MLLIASALALLSIALLIVRPVWGIPAVFIARPFVDTTWAEQVVGTLKLTELFSVAVPTIVLLHMLFSGTTRAAFRHTPMRWIWVLWIADVAWFAGMILFNNEMADGFNVFFRHL